jgi:hypothetical protein
LTLPGVSIADQSIESVLPGAANMTSTSIDNRDVPIGKLLHMATCGI